MQINAQLVSLGMHFDLTGSTAQVVNNLTLQLPNGERIVATLKEEDVKKVISNALPGGTPQPPSQMDFTSPQAEEPTPFIFGGDVPDRDPLPVPREQPAVARRVAQDEAGYPIVPQSAVRQTSQEEEDEDGVPSI